MIHCGKVGARRLVVAEAGYRANYTKGWDGLAGICEMPFAEFKDWVLDPIRTAKPAGSGSTTFRTTPRRRPALLRRKLSDHRLEAAVDVGGERRTYRVLVRKGSDGTYHYCLEADRAEIEKPRASSPPIQQGKAGSLNDAQGASLNLKEAPARINPLWAGTRRKPARMIPS